MAKRFTDTDKWKKEWFLDLAPNAKLFWFYLCDNCDHAGIWSANFKLASYCLGIKILPENVALWFPDRVICISEDKYLVVGFLDFQYGNRDSSFKAKASAIKRLEEFNLLDENKKIKDLGNSYQRVTEHLPKCTSISISIGKSKKGSVRENISVDNLNQIYSLYPNKKGKSAGYTFLQKTLKPEEIEQIKTAVKKYATSVEGQEKKYIKHFSTFVREWRDWYEMEPESVSGFRGIADILGYNPDEVAK